MQTISFLEFQAFNDGRVLTIDDTKKQIRDEYYQEDAMECMSAFYSLCALAAISACDTHTVKAVDYLGNVWNGCSVTLLHAQPAPEPEA